MRRFFVAVVICAVAIPVLATEPNPSQRQRALVEKLLEMTNVNAASLSMMDAMFAEIEKQFLEGAAAKGNEPEDVAEAKELFTAFRERTAKLDVEGLMGEAYVRIYSKYFTEKELEELIAFYSTAVGRKTIEVMPHLVREGMEAGVREISPKIEQIMSEVRTEHEKKRPWRRTMQDMRRVAAAIEEYASDHDDLYPEGDYESLKAILVPTYVDQFPEKDIWGHAYAYIVSADRKDFRLVSAAADSIFEWDSRRIVPVPENAAVRYRDRLEDDIIYGGYQFLQLPVHAKREHED